MDVSCVAALAILVLVPYAHAGIVEVPVVEEFNEAMMNSDSDNITGSKILEILAGSDMLNAGFHDADEDLNVSSDKVRGYPDDRGDVTGEIRNGEHQETNLAALMLPWVVVAFVMLIAAIVSSLDRKHGQREDGEEDCEGCAPATRFAPPTPMNDSEEDTGGGVYSINVYNKTEYIPHGYFV